MQRKYLIGVGVMVMSALVVTAACGGDDGPTAPSSDQEPSRSLRISFDGLEALGDGFIYEGWLVTESGPVSTGTFSVNPNGSLSRGIYEVDQPTLRSAMKFVVTIEPSPDSDPLPAATKYLGGDWDGNSASLSVADGATLMNDFSSAAGSYILATPSSPAMDDEANGIWWLVPPPPTPSLTLPMLPAGWMYEGWVVGPGGPVSTGRFTNVAMADSDGGGPGKGPMGTPPVPGQDFVMPPMPLTGYHAVISIEPEPDDSPGPFTPKPLVAEIGASTHMSQSMDNNAGSFPTGMATR